MIEDRDYYFGLPSKPILVARATSSATPWTPLINSEQLRVRKELRPIGNHVLVDVWENGLSTKVLGLLVSMRVKVVSKLSYR